MKNIIRDQNGNIIVRYIDTCGKYYTYEYTQSINHIQYDNSKSTPPEQPIIIKEAPPVQPTQNDPYSKFQNALINKGLDLLSKVDSNTISNMVSTALSQSNKTTSTTPTTSTTTPVPSSFHTNGTTPPFTEYFPQSNDQPAPQSSDNTNTNEQNNYSSSFAISTSS
jgi:hypothetical protein